MQPQPLLELPDDEPLVLLLVQEELVNELLLENELLLDIEELVKLEEELLLV